jgi:hypothetical protein
MMRRLRPGRLAGADERFDCDADGDTAFRRRHSSSASDMMTRFESTCRDSHRPERWAECSQDASEGGRRCVAGRRRAWLCSPSLRGQHRAGMLLQRAWPASLDAAEACFDTPGNRSRSQCKVTSASRCNGATRRNGSERRPGLSQHQAWRQRRAWAPPRRWVAFGAAAAAAVPRRAARGRPPARRAAPHTRHTRPAAHGKQLLPLCVVAQPLACFASLSPSHSPLLAVTPHAGQLSLTLSLGTSCTVAAARVSHALTSLRAPEPSSRARRNCARCRSILTPRTRPSHGAESVSHARQHTLRNLTLVA